MASNHELSEQNFAKMVQLRDMCSDPRAALYVIAYLTAGFEPERLDAALRAAQAWHEALAGGDDELREERFGK